MKKNVFGGAEVDPSLAPEEMGGGNYINCFLADKGAREGFLFQTIDYGEYGADAPRSRKFLAQAKKYFPELRQLVCRQGVLLSRERFSRAQADDTARLGKILGFPSAMPDEGATKKTRYGFDVSVSYRTPPAEPRKGASKDELKLLAMMRDRSDTIFSFVSTDATCAPAAEALRARLEKCLRESADFALALTGVELKMETWHSSSDLAAALLDKAHVFSPSELAAISNVWYNQVGEEHQSTFEALIANKKRLKSPLVRGIIVGMLLSNENDPASVFYPLQNHGEKVMGEFEAIKGAYEARVIETMLAAEGRAHGRST